MGAQTLADSDWHARLVHRCELTPALVLEGQRLQVTPDAQGKKLLNGLQAMAIESLPRRSYGV